MPQRVPLRIAYLDESGTVTPFRGTECFLVIAVVAGSERAMRACALHVNRLRRRARLSPGRELKATLATPEQVLRLLTAIAEEDIAIVAVVLDKRGVRRAPDDPEDWYREAVALACWHCANRWPSLSITLDKRYTKPALRQRLAASIRAELAPLGCQDIRLQQRDSQSSPGLQVADFCAWTIARKYELGDEEYYQRIRGRIVVEDMREAK